MSKSSKTGSPLNLGALLCLLTGIVLAGLSYLTQLEIQDRARTLQQLQRLQSLLEQAELELRLSPWIEEPARGQVYQQEFDTLLATLQRSSTSPALSVLVPLQADQALKRPEAGPGPLQNPLAGLASQINNLTRQGLPTLQTRLRLQLGSTLACLLVAATIMGLPYLRTLAPKRPKKVESEEPFSTLPLSFTQLALKTQRPSHSSPAISARGYTERVLQSLSNLLILAGRDGIIQMTNMAVSETLGYSQGELLGRHFNTLLAEEPKQASVSVGELETFFLAQNGNRIPVQVSCSAVHDNDGKIDGLVIVAKDITERKMTEKLIRINEVRLRNLTERLVNTQEDERQRVARDLHDGMLQSVIAAELQVNSALRKWKKSGIEVEPKALRYGLECLGEAVAQGRQLIHDLRPPILDQFGLVKSLKHAAERYQEHERTKVSFSGPAEQTEFPRQLETAFHRIFQECLSNIRKHAKAKRVTTELKVEGDWVILTVTDDGIGFDPSSVQRGIGLDSMKERAELLGGQLSISAGPEGGAMTVARIPFQTSTC